MICSRTSKVEDPYDFVARRAAEMQFALCADTADDAAASSRNGNGTDRLSVEEVMNWDMNVEKDFLAVELDDYYASLETPGEGEKLTEF